MNKIAKQPRRNRKDSELTKVEAPTTSTHDLPEEIQAVIGPLLKRAEQHRQALQLLEVQTGSIVQGWAIGQGLQGKHMQISVDGKTVTI